MDRKKVFLTELHNGNFDVLAGTFDKDILDYFTNAEHGKFWEYIHTYTYGLMEELLLDDDGVDMVVGKTEIMTKNEYIVQHLKIVATVATHYIELPQYRCQALFDTIELLHNILIPLSDMFNGVVGLKVMVSRLCEAWWTKQEAGAENLVTQLIPYLLLSSLGPLSSEADVKRLYSIRAAILLLDFEDPSIETIRTLLLRCFLHQNFLKSADGRRFLSFTFTININLHAHILAIVKPQLASTIRGVASWYGDVLFRCWKEAKGGDVITDEQRSIEDVLQGLVHDGIHASDKNYFRGIRVVMSTFHESKRLKAVDPMLTRIYGPILWRSLRCANPLVRAQAAVLFFDTFPLQNMDNSADDDALIQKQFDLLSSLLKDSDHRVRAASTTGVCHILREYWEFIPISTTRQILTYIVSTLSFDSSCANVRFAVINGLEELLEQPLSHVVLKGLLPLLHSIHDKAEKVRLAFIKLLEKVKKIKDMYFYNIVSVEHLQLRLAEDFDRPNIVKAMSRLLLNSYYPHGARGSEQLYRCVQFIRESPVAAEFFYGQLNDLASVGSAAKLCSMLFSLFSENPEDVQKQLINGRSLQDEDGSDSYEQTDGRGKRGRGENLSKNGVSSLADPTFRKAVLRVLLSTLKSIEAKISLPAHAQSCEYLKSFITTERICNFFKDFNSGERNNEGIEIASLYLEIVAVIKSKDVPDVNSDTLMTLIIDSYQNVCVNCGTTDKSIIAHYAVCVAELLCALGASGTIMKLLQVSLRSGDMNKKKSSLVVLSLSAAVELVAALIESDRTLIANERESFLKDSNSWNLYVAIKKKVQTIALQKIEDGSHSIEKEYVRLLHLWATASFRRYFLLLSESKEGAAIDACVNLECVISFVDTIVQSFERKVSRDISTSIMVVFSDMLMFDLTPLTAYEALGSWLQTISAKENMNDDAVPLMCRMLCLITTCKDKVTSDKKAPLEVSIISLLSLLAGTDINQEKCITLISKARSNIKLSVTSAVNKIAIDLDKENVFFSSRNDDRFISLVNQLQAV